MKKFYRNYRRRGNTIFFVVMGILFAGLGTLAVFFMDPIVWAAVCYAAAVLLLTVPLFVVHATYGVDGSRLRMRVLFPKKIPLPEIGAIVITAYDSYRRWKGFQAETFKSSSGDIYNIPSITFLRECDGKELDLCDTRTYTRITYKKQLIFDAALDFDFLRAFADAGYAGKVYVSELVRLAKKAFGAAPAKVLSSTKALSMYAFQRGMLAPGESLLVFDMGEEDISVVKASLLENGRLVVDGADGHNEPCDIGGNDVDDAVAEYIEGCIRRRETVGTPSFGTEGHINERGLHSKQYLFLKDIKKAKMILSVPLREGSVFEKGVPVAVARDLYIQRKLTREEFCACIGVAGNRGVARRIADYIIEEVSRPVKS